MSESTTPTSLNTPIMGNNDKKKKIKVEWSPENEKILVEWCDIAQCYKWLNSRAHSKFNRWNAYFTIPAIVLSTITGTASFAQTNLPESYQVYSPMVIGTINIAVGILTTVQQYLKISELNEAHRVASIAWDKFARNIRIELAKAPDERPDAGIFLKYNRDEYDRLMETSPSIPESIINIFTKTFSAEHETDPRKKKQFELLKKPDICDIIISAEENRHHWYKELENSHEYTDFEEKMEKDLLGLQAELREKEMELVKKEKDMENQVLKEIQEKQNQLEDEKAKYEECAKQIQDFIVLFESSHGREPVQDEIEKHFQENEEVIKIITIFLEHRAIDKI